MALSVTMPLQIQSVHADVTGQAQSKLACWGLESGEVLGVVEEGKLPCERGEQHSGAGPQARSLVAAASSSASPSVSPAARRPVRQAI